MILRPTYVCHSLDEFKREQDAVRLFEEHADGPDSKVLVTKEKNKIFLQRDSDWSDVVLHNVDRVSRDGGTLVIKLGRYIIVLERGRTEL